MWHLWRLPSHAAPGPAVAAPWCPQPPGCTWSLLPRPTEDRPDRCWLRPPRLSPSLWAPLSASVSVSGASGSPRRARGALREAHPPPHLARCSGGLGGRGQGPALPLPSKGLENLGGLGLTPRAPPCLGPWADLWAGALRGQGRWDWQEPPQSRPCPPPAHLWRGAGAPVPHLPARPPPPPTPHPALHQRRCHGARSSQAPSRGAAAGALPSFSSSRPNRARRLCCSVSPPTTPPRSSPPLGLLGGPSRLHGAPRPGRPHPLLIPDRRAIPHAKPLTQVFLT